MHFYCVSVKYKNMYLGLGIASMIKHLPSKYKALNSNANTTQIRKMDAGDSHPSYSGGRDQEDRGSKPAPGK
jgi:hypothetical protein